MLDVHTKTPNRLLQHEREMRGWSKTYVAKSVNTNHFTVWRWEMGISFPSPKYRSRLCQLFEKSAAELGLMPSASSKQHKLEVSPLYDSAIPQLLHSLVGRDRVLVSLKHFLLDKHHATTLAVKGLPGVGKTALAVALAHDTEVRTHFSDGILWAGLGPHPNIADLLSRWGQLLGFSATSMQKLTNVEEVAKAIRTAIGTRHILIVIDDAWTIEDVFAFHVGGPYCTYFITTRQTGVALHCAGHTSTIDELSEDEGVALLTQLAPVSKHVLHDVRTLVRSVGGLPLALTLMGRYIRTETFNKHLRRLSHAIEKLHSVEERFYLTQPLDPTEGISSLSGSKTFSLHTVIALSDQRLSQEAQSALRTLALFLPKPNVFQETAALAIAAIAAKTLDELTDAGLVESQGQGYYTLHQVIADYARTADARDADVRKATEERMVLYFMDIIQAHKQHYTALERDAQNILTAFDIACQRTMFTTLLNGINIFAPFWIIRGQQQLAIHYLCIAQHIAIQHEDMRNFALTWVHLGRIAALSGNLTQADTYYERGLVYARQSGDITTISILLTRWCELMVNRGEHKRAEQYIEENWTLAQTLQDKGSIASSLRNLGELANIHGDYARSIACYEEGLQLARECEDDLMISTLLQNLGSQASRKGDYVLAQQYYEEGLLYARKIQHQQRISALLMHQGFLAFLQKDYDHAEALSQESLELAYAGNNCIRIAWVLQTLGILETAREHYALAAQHFSKSYDIACEIEHTWIASETLCKWGELHLACEEWDMAREKFARAYQGSQSMEAAELIAMSLFGLARAAAGCQEYDKANELGCESYTLYEKMGHPRGKVIDGWLKTVPAAHL
ncbi:MAG: hypothetical protein PVS3B3_03940 [Ktedonobacteraceae bacterium]